MANTDPPRSLDDWDRLISDALSNLKEGFEALGNMVIQAMDGLGDEEFLQLEDRLKRRGCLPLVEACVAVAEGKLLPDLVVTYLGLDRVASLKMADQKKLTSPKALLEVLQADGTVALKPFCQCTAVEQRQVIGAGKILAAKDQRVRKPKGGWNKKSTGHVLKAASETGQFDRHTRMIEVGTEAGDRVEVDAEQYLLDLINRDEVEEFLAFINAKIDELRQGV